MAVAIVAVSQEEALKRCEPLIRRVASDLARRECPYDDLCQEGRLATMDAARRATRWNATYFRRWIIRRMRRATKAYPSEVGIREGDDSEVESPTGLGDLSGLEQGDLIARVILHTRQSSENRSRLRILVRMRLDGCEMAEIASALGIKRAHAGWLWWRFRQAARRVLSE